MNYINYDNLYYREEDEFNFGKQAEIEEIEGLFLDELEKLEREGQ